MQIKLSTYKKKEKAKLHSLEYWCIFFQAWTFPCQWKNDVKILFCI